MWSTVITHETYANKLEFTTIPVVWFQMFL